jgi:hypothetical protein
MSNVREHPTLIGYGADEEGGVWSRHRMKEWRRLSLIRNQGYLHFKPGGRWYKVHRFVLECFVGPCPAGMMCRHIDGDRTNNRLSNLAWGTAAENKADAIAHGTSVNGERTGTAKLTESQVLAIRQDGRPHHALAAEYGVGKSTIGRIKIRESWAYLADPPSVEAST